MDSRQRPLPRRYIVLPNPHHPIRNVNVRTVSSRRVTSPRYSSVHAVPVVGSIGRIELWALSSVCYSPLICKASSRVGYIFDASGRPTIVLIWLGSRVRNLCRARTSGGLWSSDFACSYYLHAPRSRARTLFRQLLRQAEGNPLLAWVAQVLKRMQTIRPGMTREKLLTIFTTEGGLSTPLERKFVSRDCPYFKVDIEFQAVGRPTREAMNG